MSILDILYTLLIMPLQLMFEALYMLAYNIIGDAGIAIIALSLAMNFLVLPLYMRADAMQEHERDMELKLNRGVSHIKKTFKGDERMLMLQTYYRQNHYKPTDVFKGSISLFLEIPFFISAYLFLSHLPILSGVSLWVISDLGAPDGLLNIGGFSINVLPFIMTAINLVSCVIFTKGHPLKTKLQLYGMALFFLVFLYASPAGLVFYWTLNNVFALVKTIFYKLKNPKRALLVMFFVAGLAAAIYGSACYFPEDVALKAFVIVFGVGCMLPGMVALGKGFLAKRAGERIDAPAATEASNKSLRGRLASLQPNMKIHVLGGIMLTVLLGLVIPASVIVSSPQEFINPDTLANPIWFTVNSGCLAAGFFLVWMSVFYWLANKQAKVIFNFVVIVACFVAVMDFMCFGTELGSLSSTLQYGHQLVFEPGVIALNLVCVLALGVVALLTYVYGKRAVPTIIAVAAVAFAVMYGSNAVTINGSFADIKPTMEAAKADQPNFTLSKTKQNVVVIMMDRALSTYLPYVLQEKPELAKSLDGFTYYANAVSYGSKTNIASPAFYGGYEYTPEESYKRKDMTLEEKQNEALKVMPVMFDQAGYDVTVCDPTYAGYSWVPDLSIYDDYPDIKSYVTLGYWTDPNMNTQVTVNNKRNFFCYSLMKASPVFLQGVLYNGGKYNKSDADFTSAFQVVSEDNLTATGKDKDFVNASLALNHLPAMTQVTEKGNNTFLMFANDTAHEPCLLQEGDYVPELTVDNTEYEAQHGDRFTVDGVTLKMETAEQVTHYHAYMAAIMGLSKWFDYLREQGVYDNTRIVIASDHGIYTEHLEDRIMEGGDGDPENVWNKMYDTEGYHPLMLVKDFNATGFTTSQEFMTNADVPCLATAGIIEHATNPFTGKELARTVSKDEVHVFGSLSWNTGWNHGKTYRNTGVWFSVHDDGRDLKNWKLIEAPWKSEGK